MIVDKMVDLSKDCYECYETLNKEDRIASNEVVAWKSIYIFGRKFHIRLQRRFVKAYICNQCSKEFEEDENDNLSVA